MSREPCVLVWSEVIRLSGAEPKGLHTGGQAIGTDTTGRLPQLSCGRAGKEQVARDPDSQRTADAGCGEFIAVAGVSPLGKARWESPVCGDSAQRPLHKKGHHEWTPTDAHTRTQSLSLSHSHPLSLSHSLTLSLSLSLTHALTLSHTHTRTHTHTHSLIRSLTHSDSDTHAAHSTSRVSQESLTTLS